MRKYLSAAKEEGIAQDGPAPSEEQLSRLAGISRAGPRQVETPVKDSLAPWADQIYQWLTGGRRPGVAVGAGVCGVVHVVAAVHQRFISKRNWGPRSVRTVRMADTAPGVPLHHVQGIY